MKFKFFSFNKIGGTFYDSESGSKTLVIYAMGAPTVPDNGTLTIAPYILDKKIDLFVPDYIGFGRSYGKFTPKGCIRTLLLLYNSFKRGVFGVNHYELEKRFFKYKRIIFVGKSLGAVYVVLLPKYKREIKEIGIFCGSMDQSEQGKIKGEESNKSFIEGLSKDFTFLYRGMNPGIWWKHVEDGDGLSPMDNIGYLENTRVFIAHGAKDTCVHYSKSVKFYEKLVKTFPNKVSSFKLRLYRNGDHGASTTDNAINDFLKWISV